MRRARQNELEAMRSRIDELERRLPRLEREHEELLRNELDLWPAAGEDDPVGRLEQRLAMLEAERKHLLVDRRTSLRARLWPAWARVRWWKTPRVGVLWQQPPATLRVPRRYARARPPSPAPTISVVTPCFQHVEFIESCVRSVVEQGYPALEYVVQDGGSTDGTLEVLRRWEPSFSNLESGPDGGQAEALNRGFARTSGEIMAWLNSDDVLLPGALACAARYLAAHPEVDAVYGHRVLIDEDDRHVGIWALPPHDDTMLSLADCVPQETLFWRRGLWEKVGGTIDESFRYALDWDLLLRFRAAGAKIVRLNRYLGAFRVHERQKTTDWRDIGECEIARLRERTHGRPVGWPETIRRIRPYLRRQVVHHTAHRLVHRMPGRRLMAVPWLEGERRPSD